MIKNQYFILAIKVSSQSNLDYTSVTDFTKIHK